MQTLESYVEFFDLCRVLLDNESAEDGDKKVVVISISPQSLSSIAARFSLSMDECLKKLTRFFKDIGCNYVFDTNMARNFSLMETQKEFIER